MVLMILIAVGLAAAQVGLAFLAIVAPLALLAGLLPGSARQPLRAWFVGVLKALTAVMASIMFLGVFLLLVNASLASSEGKPLLARLAVLDILVLFGIGLRKRLVAAAQSVASGITSKVASSSAGGPPIGGFWGSGAAIGGSGGSAGAAGVEGGDVAGLWRDTRGEIGRLPRMYRDIRLGLAARRPRAGTGLRPARDLDTGPRRRRDPSDLAEDVGADGRRDRLVAELGRSKTGRGVLGATRAGAAGTKFGWAATLGLPVSVPRASRAGREAARRSGQSLRDELVRQKAAGAAYWKEWGDGVAGGARLAYRGTGARAAVTRMRRSPTPEPAGVAPSGTGAPLRQGRNRPPTSLQHRIRPPAGRSAVEPISGHGGARTAVPPRGSGRRGTSVLTPPRAAGTHAAPASTVRTAVPPDGPGLSPGQELPPLPPPAEILRNLQARLGR